MSSRRQKREHVIARESLIRISCKCGWYWYNEHLKDKSDADLALEAHAEFRRHFEDMREQNK